MILPTWWNGKTKSWQKKKESTAKIVLWMALTESIFRPVPMDPLFGWKTSKWPSSCEENDGLDVFSTSLTVHRFLLLDRLNGVYLREQLVNFRQSATADTPTVKLTWPPNLKLWPDLSPFLLRSTEYGCKPILSCLKQLLITSACYCPTAHQPREAGKIAGSLWKAGTK